MCGCWQVSRNGFKTHLSPSDAHQYSNRLANLDHNLKVLLIEAGESNLNNPWVFRPGIFPRNMKLDSKTATFYESKPSKWLGGRGAIVPAAHILGGGSSINFMVSPPVNICLQRSSLTRSRCTPELPRQTTTTSKPKDGPPRNCFRS